MQRLDSDWHAHQDLSESNRGAVIEPRGYPRAHQTRHPDHTFGLIYFIFRKHRQYIKCRPQSCHQ